MGGTVIDRYDLANITQESFSSGGATYLGAASLPVSITGPAGSDIRFSFRRNATDCFGQADIFVDARLEDGKAIRVPEDF